MAGELKLNNVSVATENAGTVTIAPNNVQFAANHAGIKTALNASGSAPVYACRAWVNFDGANANATFTEANGGIRDSGNVTSITNTNTGKFTINFDVEMPDANYVVTGSTGNAGVTTAGRMVTLNDTLTASSCAITTTHSDTIFTDDEQTTLAFFR